jgi:hypothetical protein
MALSNLIRVRLNIFDQYREFQESQLGDGSSKEFRLSSFPIKSNSQDVYKASTLQTEGADYTLDDDTGKLSFTSAPIDGVSVFVRGQASVFSDTELNDLLLQHSSDVRGATIHAFRILMADYARREKWRAGDGGIEVDPTKTVEGLKKLIDTWLEDAVASALDEGGVEEWAVTQAEFR